jgi:hypothetical protein
LPSVAALNVSSPVISSTTRTTSAKA